MKTPREPRAPRSARERKLLLARALNLANQNKLKKEQSAGAGGTASGAAQEASHGGDASLDTKKTLAGDAGAEKSVALEEKNQQIHKEAHGCKPGEASGKAIKETTTLVDQEKLAGAKKPVVAPSCRQPELTTEITDGRGRALRDSATGVEAEGALAGERTRPISPVGADRGANQTSDQKEPSSPVEKPAPTRVTSSRTDRNEKVAGHLQQIGELVAPDLLSSGTRPDDATPAPPTTPTGEYETTQFSGDVVSAKSV